MNIDGIRPRLGRRLVILGSSGLLAAAGISGYLALQPKGVPSPVRTSRPPAASTPLLTGSVQTAPEKADTPDPAETPSVSENAANTAGPNTTTDGPDASAGSSAGAQTEQTEGPDTATDASGGFADTSANAQTEQQGEN
jgi:hypothetical protein